MGQVTMFDRPVYLVVVPNYTALSEVELPSTHSVLLLVSDASGVDTETIYSAASRLIEQGVIYACTWGIDCKRVHDIFDDADPGRATNSWDDFIMTTWHTDEPLSDAVEFFLKGAFPMDHHLDNCSWIAIVVRCSTPISAIENAITHGVNATNTD